MKRMAVQLEEDHKLEENDRGLSEAESVMDECERQDSAQELTYVTHAVQHESREGVEEREEREDTSAETREMEVGTIETSANHT